MFSKLTDALRGARRAELFVILAIAAILILALMKTGTYANQGSMEKRLSDTLEKIHGAGNVQVMINEDSQGNPVGILIVAEGAGDISVRLEILQSVKTLMGVDADQIEITRMGGNGT